MVAITRSSAKKINPAFPWFDKPCQEAFNFLVARYGFDPPEIRQLGRECFITYRKDNRWVSIAYEPYSIPIVELFYPTHDIENRRIPRLQRGISNPKKFADTDEMQQRITLLAQAADLEATESEFLSANAK